MAENLRWPPQALFFDRDGTLIKHIPYLSDPDQVELEPGVRETLREAKECGCKLFLHTNQSGIGRGYFELKDAVACNSRMIELLDLGGPVFDEICIAPEDPTKDQSVYRKPEARFANEMMQKYGLDLSRCYMIGDSMCDVETGLNTGMIPVGLWRDDDDPEALDLFRECGALVFESVQAFWSAAKASANVS